LPRLNGWTRKKSLLFLGVVFITGLVLSFIFQNPAPLILAVIGSISYGSEYTTSQACNAVSCDTIDSTHFVLVHRGGDVFYQLYARICTISNGNEISFGSAYSLGDWSGLVPRVSVLDSTHFVMAYYAEAAPARFVCMIGTVSGSTISFGSEYTAQETGRAGNVAVLALDSTHFVMGYGDSTANDGSLIYGTVSAGDEVSFGSITDFETTGTPDTVSLAKIDSATFVVCYRYGGTTGYCRVCTVSGTTITANTRHAIQGGDSSTINCKSLDSTHIVVAYADEGDSGKGKTVIGVISGTAITFGSEYTFNNADTGGGSLSVDILDSTHFIVAYSDIGNSSYGTAVLGTVSAGDEITFGSEYVFNGAATYGISITSLNGYNFAIGYKDSGNSDYLTAIVGTESGLAPKTKELTEIIAMSSNLGNQTGKTFLASLSVTPAYSSVLTVVRTLTEAIAVVPIFVMVATFYKVLLEVVTIIGTKLLQSAKIFVESFIVNPVFDRLVTAYREFVEVVVAVPAILNQSAKIFIENIKASHAYETVLTAVKILSEVVVTGLNTIFNTTKTFIENIKVVGNIVKAMANRVFTEVLSIVNPVFDRLVTAYREFVEVVVAVPAILNQSAKIFIENIKASHAYETVLTAVKILSEVVVTGLNTIFNTTKTFIENIKVVGNIVKAMANRVFTEVLSIVNPVIEILNIYTKVLSEVLNVVEITMEKVLSAVKVLIEQVIIAPVFLTVSTFYKVLSEAITATDSLIKAAGRSFLEAVNVVSNKTTEIARLFVESISAVDLSVGMQKIKLFVESLIVGGSMIFSTSRIFVETVIVNWAKLTHRAFIFTDRLVVRVVSAPFTIGKLLIERIIGATTWAFEKTQFIELTDVVKVVASFTKNNFRVFSERIIVAGSVVYQTARTFIESVAVSVGSFVAARAYYFTETVSVAGTFVLGTISKLLTEVLKVRIIFTEGRTKIMTEIVAVSSSMVSSISKIFVEVVNVISSKTVNLGRIFTQTVRAVDTTLFKKTQFKILTDSVRASVSFIKDTGRVFVESVVVIGSIGSWAIGKLLVEPVKVIASYLGTWTLARVYSESVSVVSNLSNQAGKILTETINVIGAFVLGTISKVLTETVLIYDTIAKSLPKVFSESVAVVSESFNQGGKIFTETVSIIGQFVLGTISKLLTEVVKVYDTYLKEWTLSRVFTETVSVVSEALNQAGKIFEEVVSVVGTFVLGTISKVLVEVVKVYEVFNNSITRVFSEIISVSGAVYNQAGKIFSEVLSVVSAMGSFVIGKLLLETAKVGQSLTKTTSRIFTQFIVVTHSAVKYLSGRIFSENPKVVNPTMTKLTGRTFTETLEIGWAKIKLVLNGIQVGLWKKIARVTTGVWRKISRNDN
jgi:hypothetical protein